FYGIPPKDFADPAKMRVPFQGHFANQDDWCTPAAVDELEKALKSAGIEHEIYRYDAAHAFANERSAAYDVACANQAWDRRAACQRPSRAACAARCASISAPISPRYMCTARLRHIQCGPRVVV